MTAVVIKQPTLLDPLTKVQFNRLMNKFHELLRICDGLSDEAMKQILDFAREVKQESEFVPIPDKIRILPVKSIKRVSYLETP